ncbi:MAG TPA: DNA-binding protein, partial [Coprococcus sp.]|nr:DNA-binding protein [Coprococcus sp.]
VNQYCAEGRIPGASRFGRSWAIPENAEKPSDPRFQGQHRDSGRTST